MTELKRKRSTLTLNLIHSRRRLFSVTTLSIDA